MLDLRITIRELFVCLSTGLWMRKRREDQKMEMLPEDTDALENPAQAEPTAFEMKDMTGRPVDERLDDVTPGNLFYVTFI